MTVSVAARIGPFEVISPIGAGGMGEVYRAKDPRLGRELAIKVLPADFARDSERLHRFEQEARAAGSLSNPNLVTIFELGTHEGAPYIAMELLDGSTLRERLRSGKSGESGAALPQRKAAEIAMQIANGLAAAHEKGLVHRDIKPENIFVTRDGQAKILDFGIVKLTQPLAPTGSQLPTVPKTSPGMVVGTASYMSPEQVSGKEVDHRSDIFSLGLVLYEMLSGRRAFRAATPVETMNAILHDDPPPLSGEGGHVSASLERIVRRCLEKDPRQRFHSAHDLMFALEAVGEASSASAVSVETQEPARRTQRWASAIAIAVAVAAAAAGWFGRSALRQPTVPREPVPTIRRLTWEPGIEYAPSVSPDGASFAYQGSSSGNSDIYLRRIGGETAINLTKDCTKLDAEPAFSPDGQSIAFWSDRDGGGIYVMGATGESARRLTDFGHYPSWSPDGKSIAFSLHMSEYFRRGGIWVVDARGGPPRKIFEGESVMPAWSPSGNRIAFGLMTTGSALGRVSLCSIPSAGGGPTVVLEVTKETTLRNPCWTSEGIYFTNPMNGVLNIWRIRVDEATGARLGDAQLIAGGTNAQPPSLTCDSKRLLFASAQGTKEGLRYDVTTSPPRVGESQVVFVDGRDVQGDSPSPDGRWLVAVLFEGGAQDLLLIQTSTGEKRRLTHDDLREDCVVWAPDSSKIYFSTAPKARTEVWSIRPDGSGREFEVAAPGGEDVLAVGTSPDGRRLYAAVGARRIPHAIDLTVEASRRKPEPLPPISPGELFSFSNALQFWTNPASPDGRSLLGFRAEASGKPESQLYLYDIETKGYRKIADVGMVHGCAWLPDSRRILVWTFRDVKVLDSATGTFNPVGTLSKAIGDIALSSDGRSLFGILATYESDIWMLDYANPLGVAASR